MNKDSTVDTNKFEICTLLKEIYPSAEIEEKYEPVYEDLRNKYRNLFSKTDPAMIVRVPYTITLFGDNITKLFPDKIVSNLSSDVVFFINKNTTDELNVKFFDNFYEFKAPIASFDLGTVTKKEGEEVELKDFIINGYMSGLVQSKIKKYSGANILILLNTTNTDNNFDLFISSFLASMLSAMYLNNSLPKSKQNFYETALLSLSSLIKDKMSYYSSYLYFKIFLKKNSLGFSIGNTFFQNEIENYSKYKQFVFDSFSPRPIMAYSSGHYWNKRKVECRLGMALILKRYNESITEEELIAKTSDISTFYNCFDNNAEIVLQMLEKKKKKEMHTKQEIKDELKIDLIKLLKGIDFPDGALMTHEFFLYNRLYFVFKEYQTVMTLYAQSRINDKIDWVEMLSKSGELMKEQYDCYSEEMKALSKKLKETHKKIGIRAISDGWSGQMVVVGIKEEVALIEKEVYNYYEKYNENMGDNLVSAWISDDLNRYCYSSDFGNCMCLLDTKYEDFMLEYVTMKNNVIRPENAEEIQNNFLNK